MITTIKLYAYRMYANGATDAHTTATMTYTYDFSTEKYTITKPGNEWPGVGGNTGFCYIYKAEVVSVKFG